MTYKAQNIQQDTVKTIAARDTTVLHDTLPASQQPDSLEEIPDGINPLFIMLERKEQEIKAQKEQEAEQPRVVQAPKKAPVDTTCYFCPDSSPKPLHELVLPEDQNLPNFYDTPLYNNQYYIDSVGSSGPVFIETIEQSHLKPLSNTDIKPINEPDRELDWILWPIVLLVILAGTLKVFFLEYIVSFFRSSIFFFIARKLKHESSVIWTRITLLLDWLFILSMPMAGVLMLEYWSPSITLPENSMHLYFYLIVGVIGFRVFRFITTKAIGAISKNTNAMDSLYYHQSLYPRILGMLLVPLMVLFAYTNESLKPLFFYLIIITLSLGLLYRTLRTFQVFINKGISMFYLFLYLCALEIIPVLVIFKEVIWE
ncbi:MAG: DUF4271 domain-containing protein [Bacteroidales bacterium]